MADLNTILCERRSYQEEPQTHDHTYAQLVIPVEGILAVTVKKRVLKHDQQMVIYIPPDAPHSFYADASNQFLVWDIPTMYVNHQETVLPLSQPLDSRWNAARDLILTEVGPEGPSSNRRLSDLFRYILGLLTVGLETESASLAYISEHYNQLLTIEQLAAIEHYNPTYYCEWFQKQHGLSPMAYVRKLRLEKAKSLLDETDYSIVQIAEQVGYKHHSTLTRLFLEHMGMLPSEYRMQSRIPVKKLPQES